MATINLQDDQVITDAVIMLKSIFIEKYQVYGFDTQELGSTWHNHRASTKGRDIKKKVGDIQVYCAPEEVDEIEEVIEVEVSKGRPKKESGSIPQEKIEGEALEEVILEIANTPEFVEPPKPGTTTDNPTFQSIIDDKTISKSEKARQIYLAGETNTTKISKLIGAHYSQVVSAIKTLK